MHKLSLLDDSNRIINITPVDDKMTAARYTQLTGVRCREFAEGDAIYVAPKTTTLREAMLGLLSGVTDPEKIAWLTPMQSSLAFAFDVNKSEEVLRAMIVQVDVGSDPVLQKLKADILALPQWS